MRTPKRWVLIAAVCAIAAIATWRLVAPSTPEPKLAAAVEADAKACAPGDAAPRADESLPAVTQPGAIDPLGATRAIHDALEPC